MFIEILLIKLIKKYITFINYLIRKEILLVTKKNIISQKNQFINKAL